MQVAPRRLAAALCAAASVAVLAHAEEPTKRTRLAPQGAASASPANPSGVTLDPDEADPKSAGAFGDEMRRLTAITEAEVGAADATFRKWVDLIRTGRADKPTMRLYSFFRSRLDPFDAPIPSGWRERGTAMLRDDRRTSDALRAWGAAHPVMAPGASGSEAPAGLDSGVGISPYGRWVPIGPYTIPGRTMGLDRPEGQPNTLYAVVADGGVWRTRDAAQTWEPLTDKLQTLSGGSILLDPNDPRVIYFGSGEGNGAIDNYSGVGVFKSVDEGLTWTKSNTFSGSVRRLAMHRSEPQRLYAAGDSGCYLSTDGGANFSLMSTVGLPTNAGASDVLVRPDDPNTVFCAIWGGANGGIYRSNDHGASFQLLTSGLPAMGTVQRISLGISKSSPNLMLAGIDQNNGTVYKTTDGGDTWTVLAGGSVGYCGGQCWYDNVVGFDSADPSVMYLSGVSLRRSLDGGATWVVSDNGVHVDHHFLLTPSPGEVYATSDGGVFHSTDQGATWSNWGLGMDTTQYYGICRHPSNAGFVMGGTQDNGSHRRNPDGTWTAIIGADGGMCMTGPPTGSVLIGETQNHNMQRSTDGGNSFVSANGGIGTNQPRPWVGILEADSGNRLNMWTGTNRVYRSLDSRATDWVGVSLPLYFSLSLSAIGVAPSNSNTVYVGFDGGGLDVATAATGATPLTWTNIRQANLPQKSVRRIRVHPSVPTTAYVVFAGYGAGKIFKTTNGGTTFTEITGDLPDVPVNDVVIDAAQPGTLIAATDLGIFRSDNDGGHWYGWSAGYPTVASIELTYDAAADTLHVGTHGRSVWEWRESAAGPLAVPDGQAIPGTMLRADKIAGGTTLRVSWDSIACTARDYNLFYGDLASVASGSYAGAVCGLGTSGTADLPMPVVPSGSLYFVVAATDGAGSEGPHRFVAPGTPSPATGVGFCGITQQVAAASCP